MELKICHLYSDLMNTYGDDGNIITLIKRCQWREIGAKVYQVTIGNIIDPNLYDLYFFGGGQDQQQIAVSQDLERVNAKLLKKAVDTNAVILAICGGYQLLGAYYKPKYGSKLKGVGLLDTYTIAGDRRMIGNIVIEVNPELKAKIYKSSIINHQSSKLVGFENHSGQTFLGPKTKPLGKVLTGYGNNGNDKTEGAWQGNIFGCYLHGSLLPKNPHFADYLITLALKRRYGKAKLKPLADSLEWQAHQKANSGSRQRK